MNYLARVQVAASIALALAILMCAAESDAGQGPQQTPASADSRAKDYSDLEGRSLVDVLHERAATKDAERARKVDSFLHEKAAPQTDEDLKFVETEVKEKEEYRRRRALVWLSNIRDAKRKPELLRFFEEQRSLLPPEHVKDLAKHPENNGEESRSQELLGTIMLKLADLNANEVIPTLRAYVKAEGADKAYVTMYAYQALAHLKDEEFFGRDRRDRLAHRHVDFADPTTKPWLKEVMLNEPDEHIRDYAAEAWSQIAANPNDSGDLAVAWQLIDNPGAHFTRDERAYRRARGFDFLMRVVAKGNFDQRIFDKAVEETQRKDKGEKSNKVEAAQLLSAFGTRSEFREQVLDALRQLLKGPDVSAQSVAQEEIGRLTGKRPHFDGEISCDEHPLRFGPPKAAPKGEK